MKEKRFAEKKVPGGKLVQVRVEESGGEIRDVSLTGDFFIYPESERKTIELALVGKSAEATAEDYAESIEKALDPNTELLGFDALTVGKLVRV